MATSTGDEGNADFLTVGNIKLCKAVFKRYMTEVFAADMPPDSDREGDAHVRMFLFDVMKNVRKHHGHVRNTRKLNDLTIAIARNIYVQRHGLVARDGPTPAPPADTHAHAHVAASGNARVNIQPLEREQQVYGNRVVPVPEFADRPQSSTAAEVHHSLDASFEKMMAERACLPFPPVSGGPKTTPDAAPHHDTDLAVEDDETEARDALAALRREPDARMPEQESARSLKALQEARSREDARLRRPPRSGQLETPPPELAPAPVPARPADPLFQGARSDFVIDQRHVKRHPVFKALLINGFDRDWITDPKRYTYTIRTSNGSMHTNFRDVVAIQATCVVLPAETVRSTRTTNTAYLEDKPIYQHDFGMSDQYLILSVDGLEGVYDGTNDNVRRALCMFVYSKQFSAANGRGYVVLEPMQDEIRRFEPSPLASLRNLKISIRRPNGRLFNDSADDYRVHKVEYEAHNEFLLKIVLDKYFDRNEFVKGDTVAFQNVRFRLAEESVGKTTARTFALTLLEDYLNRPEGHEIVHTEPSNEAGFQRAFGIFAPAKIDQAEGRLRVEVAQLNALVKHNTESSPSDTRTEGNVMNASLQNVVAFRVWMSMPDISSSLGFPSFDDGTVKAFSE